MKNYIHFRKVTLSPARQGWLTLVAMTPMAACYSAIKAGLGFGPSLRFVGLRTLVGGLAFLLVLVIQRKPLCRRHVWPAGACRWDWWPPP